LQLKAAAAYIGNVRALDKSTDQKATKFLHPAEKSYSIGADIKLFGSAKTLLRIWLLMLFAYRAGRTGNG